MNERREGDEGGFRLASVLFVAVLAAVLAAASLYFGVQPDERDLNRARATTSTSFSALGFRAFADMMSELDFEVARNRQVRSVGDLSNQLVVLPAPRSHAEIGYALDRFDDAHAILIVAVKRIEARSPAPDRSVQATRYVSTRLVERILESAEAGVDIVRPGGRPLIPSVNLLGVTPSITDPQFARHAGGRPVVAYGEADALVLEIRSRAPTIWLLADPDPLSNHGIGQGGNAFFAHRLVEALAHEDQRILIDEVLNGAIVEPAPLARLFELPWLVLSIALAVLAAVIGVAATQRFGTPKETVVGVAAGRASLVRASAALHRDQAACRAALGRYMRRTLRLVALRRHAPAGDDDMLARWLDEAAERGGGPVRASALMAEAAMDQGGKADSEARILATARRIFRWRMDMLNDQRESTAQPNPGRSRQRRR